MRSARQKLRPPSSQAEAHEPDEAGEDPLVSEGANDLEYSPSVMPEGEIPVPMPLGVDSDEEFDFDSFVPVTPPGELAGGHMIA